MIAHVLKTLFAKKSLIRTLFILAVVLLMGNLDALIDLVLHPEIPYFDEEHLIVGGASSFFSALLFVVLVVHAGRFQMAAEERKKAADMLRESEERYRNVVDNVGVGIAIISPEMEILSMNRQMREWSPAIDVSQRPICFRSFNRPPREEICSYCPTIKTLKEGRIFEAVTETPVEWGIMNFRVVSSPLRDSGGKVIAAIEVVEDMTARKRAEEEIKKLNQELELKVQERTRQLVEAQEELVRKEKLAILGRLSGSVGHELRNPLGVINNAIYFLKTVTPESDETVREYLNLIKAEVDNSQRIISDLLDFSRTKTPQMKPTVVSELISQSLERCVVPGNVTVHVDIPETLPPIMVDSFQMGQVFQNLITNAFQAMPKGGALRIAARRISSDVGAGLVPALGREGHPQEAPLQATQPPTPAFIEISVADTGEGISPENMKKLFQPLFTTKAKGIGLGLIVCNKLTEANGGKIEVSSELGEGTTFNIIFPLREG